MAHPQRNGILVERTHYTGITQKRDRGGGIHHIIPLCLEPLPCCKFTAFVPCAKNLQYFLFVVKPIHAFPVKEHKRPREFDLLRSSNIAKFYAILN